MGAIKVYLLLNGGGPRGNLLSDEQISAADLIWKGADHIWPTMTGQNRIWTRTIVMQQGLLHQNLSSVKASFEDIFADVIVQTAQQNDGVMPDGSFHQHGAQLQSGSYGGDFFSDVAELLSLTLGTRFETSKTHGNAFATFALDGEQWMMRTLPGRTVRTGT